MREKFASQGILKGMRIDRLHVPLIWLVLCASAFAQDWPMYLKDLTHASFNNAETQLDIRTISTLRPAWTTSLGGYLSAGVTLSNGVLYIGNWSGNFSAVDAQTGKIIWTTFVGKAPDPADPDCMPGIGVAGQPTVLGNTVYVGGGDSAVYALDKSNGNQLWRVPLADPSTGSYLWASMVPYNNALFVVRRGVFAERLSNRPGSVGANRSGKSTTAADSLSYDGRFSGRWNLVHARHRRCHQYCIRGNRKWRCSRCVDGKL